MNEASPELDELIRRAIEARVADVHVSMPGEIVSYSASTQTATVRPCLKRVVFSEEDDQVEEELPPIQNVPVSWPGGSGLTIHGVLASGDTGDLVFSTNSHNEWQATGRVSAPGDLKPHNLGSAKFYPGIRHKQNAAPDTDNSIGKPGGLRLKFQAGSIDVGDGSDLAVLAGGPTSGLGKLLSDILQAGVTAGGPGAPNFTAAKLALTTLLATPAWPGVVGGKLAVEP
jgi:hypothetical protein